MIETFNQWRTLFLEQGVHACAKPVADYTNRLTAAEAEVVASSVAIRKNTYSTGRHCAKAALQALGVTSAAYSNGLLRQADGSVAWPDNVIGSVSHTNDWAIAAVANIEHTDNHLQSIGIDIEQIDRVENDVLRLIATDAERAYIESTVDLRWARVALFSIKESVYKCLRPIYGEFIRFKDVQLIGLDNPASFNPGANADVAGAEFYSPSVELLLPELSVCCEQECIAIRLAVLPSHVVSFVSYSR